MKKEFILPFRLGKKQSRAVLDSQGHEVVVFPKGCEYFAAEYVESINNDLHSYKLGKTAGEVAKQFGCAIGKIGCPHCGIVSMGAIHDHKCPICEMDRFNLIKSEKGE